MILTKDMKILCKYSDLLEKAKEAKSACQFIGNWTYQQLTNENEKFIDAFKKVNYTDFYNAVNEIKLN
jgi:hypothetical protein